MASQMFAILSGPSCVGKGPLVAALNRFYPDVEYAVLSDYLTQVMLHTSEKGTHTFNLLSFGHAKNCSSGVFGRPAPGKQGSFLTFQHFHLRLTRPLRLEHAGAFYHVTASLGNTCLILVLPARCDLLLLVGYQS